MTSITVSSLLCAVSWTTVATVGTTGLVLEPAERVPSAVVAVVEAPAQKLDNIKLVEEPDNAPEPDNKPMTPDTAITERMLDSPPAAPECAAMAAGSQVAFALPVAAPTRITDKAGASGRPVVGVVGGVPGGKGGLPVAKISLGKGFGSGLAKPRYPEQARRAGWQGDVTIKLAVDASGRILIAKVASSSGWPVLDQEALETVRFRWKNFPAPGAPSAFEWVAHFVLE